MFYKDQIIKIIEDNLSTIISDYDPNFIILYGSVATETAKWWSDIDIVADIPPDVIDQNDRDVRVALSVYLDALLDTDKVHVSTWDKLPPHVKFDIIKSGIPIFIKDKEKYRDMIEYTLKVYWDHRIWYDRFLDEALEV